MQGPAILHRHLKDDAVETYVTGDGVHTRRSDDLVPP